MALPNKGQKRATKLDGLFPLSYMGVVPISPSNFNIVNRSPASSDYASFNVGDVWLDMSGYPTSLPTASNLWILVAKASGSGTWINFGSGGGGGVTEFDTDSGTATPSGGVINILGSTNIETSGAGNTVTIALASTLSGITNLTVTNLTVNNTTTLAGLMEGVLVSDNSGVISSSIGTTGQILQTLSTGAPGWATLVAGSNITLTNIDNSITIASSGGGSGGPGGVTSWVFVTAASQAMDVDTGYVSNRATLVTMTLPAVAATGTVLRVKGMGAGGWSIAQGAGQSIAWDATASTTVGAAGSLASTDQYDAVELLCIVADLTWSVLSSQGNITIV